MANQELLNVPVTIDKSMSLEEAFSALALEAHLKNPDKGVEALFAALQDAALFGNAHLTSQYIEQIKVLNSILDRTWQENNQADPAPDTEQTVDSLYRALQISEYIWWAVFAANQVNNAKNR